MRRTPIVIAATAAGLAAVLSFHTKSASLTLGGVPGASAPRGSTTAGTSGSPPPQGATGTSSPPTSNPSPTPPTTVPSSTRTVTGPEVNYQYGILSVSVTATGKKITKVGIAYLDDGGNFRSQSIDQQSIPMLEQQALQAQNANIQGVSGASYTSAGFAQSLQAALSQLGIA